MIKEFENLLISTKRDGIERLLEFIRKSDFLYGTSKNKISFLP